LVSPRFPTGSETLPELAGEAACATGGLLSSESFQDSIVGAVTQEKPLGFVRSSGSEFTSMTQLGRHVKGSAQSGRGAKRKERASLRANPVGERSRSTPSTMKETLRKTPNMSDIRDRPMRPRRRAPCIKVGLWHGSN